MTRGLLCLFQLSGTGEYHVDRTYEDFEWLQQHLFSQEEVPGIQGVIVSAFNFTNAQSPDTSPEHEDRNPLVA